MLRNNDIKQYTLCVIIILLMSYFQSCIRTGPQDLEGNKYLHSNSGLRVKLDEIWIRLGDRMGEIDQDHGLVSVDVAEFSNNSEFIVSGSSAGNDLIIWEVKSGKKLFHDSCENEIESVCFSPDDKYLFAGGKFKNLLIWDTGTWKRKKDVEFDSGIEYMKFSHNGELLAIGHIDGRISILDGKSFKVLKQVIHTPKEKMKDYPTKDRGDVNSLDFSLDDKYLVSGGLDGKLIIWEVAQMTIIRTLEGHDASVKSVRISPQLSCIASASVSQKGRDDNSIKIWNFNSGNLIHTLTFPLGMEAVEFSLDGSILAAGGREGAKSDSVEEEQGNIYFYAIPDDPVNKPIVQVHKEPVFRSEYLDFNNEGDLLVSSHEDGTLRLWKFQIEGIDP